MNGAQLDADLAVVREVYGSTTGRWPLTHHARPWLANADRRMHWSKKARLVAEWRQTFWGLAKEARVPHLERARIEVIHWHGSGVWPDVSACAPAAKAAIDGIVDAGVLPDDDASHLIAVSYSVLKMPTQWKRPGVTGALGLVVVEVAA